MSSAEFDQRVVNVKALFTFIFQTDMQKSNVDPKMKRKGRYSKDSNDNFFVKRDKFMIVKQFKEKIERMFEIQLGFEDPVDDGQWLNLQGDQGDRRNAKVYL